MVLFVSVIVLDSMRTVETFVMSLDIFGDLHFEFRRKSPRKRVVNSPLERWAMFVPLDKRPWAFLRRKMIYPYFHFILTSLTQHQMDYSLPLKYVETWIKYKNESNSFRIRKVLCSLTKYVWSVFYYSVLCIVILWFALMMKHIFNDILSSGGKAVKQRLLGRIIETQQ